MRRRKVLLLLVVPLVALVYLFWMTYSPGDWKSRTSPEQRLAIEAIEAQRGRVRQEPAPDGRQGVAVAFTGPRITDAALASLRGLSSLHTLYIHETKVTGEGLANLEGHADLQALSLMESKVTDASLAHVAK